MSWLREIGARFSATLRQRRIETEMAAEMQHHIELRADRNIAAGMAPDEARRAAQRAFGQVEQIKERARDRRTLPWLEHLVRDVRLAARQLLKSPGFTIVAVLSLALCIGINATMLWYVRSFVVQPLLRERHDRLVAIYAAGRSASREYRNYSYADFEAVRAASDLFTDVAAYGFQTCVVGRPGEFRHSLVALTSANYFSVLHLQPWRGRFFTTAEARPEAHQPVVVASHALWSRLGARADLVGRELIINGTAYTVVGVAPESGASASAVGPDLWVPLGMAREIGWGTDALGPQSYPLRLLGNLAPGVSFAHPGGALAQLDQQLNTGPLAVPKFPRQLVLARPPRFDLGAKEPANDRFLVPFAAIGAALAVCVLLVGSLNLANMVFARGLARQKEIAIRLSLGATRARVVSQLLIESLLLAAAGGVLGQRLGAAAGDFMRRTSSGSFSALPFNFADYRNHDVLDSTLIGLLCLGAALVFGLGPALRCTRINVIEYLKRQTGEPARSGHWNRFFSARHALMMAQVALSFALLFSAGLFVRAAQRAGKLDPGFDARHGVVLAVDYVNASLSNAEIARHEQALLTRCAGLPGVTGVALASSVPFHFETSWWHIYPTATDATSAGSGANVPAAREAVMTVVSSDYFATLGIPLLSGRGFTAAESTSDRGPKVAIVDAGLARACFGDGNVIGRHFATSQRDADGRYPQREIEIVGVIRGPHEDPLEPTAPFRIYFPLGQRHEESVYMHLQVARPEDVVAVLASVRHELAVTEPLLPVLLAQPLREVVDKNLYLLVVRFGGMVFGAAGCLALLLAVLGVYGLKAHAVARRTREIGIRMALGAQSSEVLSLIVRQGAQQTAVGLAVGLVLALVAGRLAARMLFHVSPADPVVLLGAAVVLGTTMLLACYLPARRATRIDPSVTLRAE